MKQNRIPFFIVLVVAALFFSCKKKAESLVKSQSFYFEAYDENGFSDINSVQGNTFVIHFYQNNSIVYTIKTKKAGIENFFTIDNFQNGGYSYEITDSLHLFGYYKDSIYIKDNTYYLGGITKGTKYVQLGGSPGGDLGSIQHKPTYTIVNSFSKDTTGGIYIKINVSGVADRGNLLVYFFKNNQVSSSNLYHYGVLCSTCYTVSNSQQSISTILTDYNFTNGTNLQSGDSVYVAVYPAPYDCSDYSIDKLAPKDLSGFSQFTSVGSQKIIIPYKLP